LSKNIIPSFILEILNIPNLFNKLSVIFSLQLIKKNQLFSLVRYYPIKGYLEDFYLSNKNTKNSLIMLETSRSMRKKFTNFN
jgi:hypothetical protein